MYLFVCVSVCLCVCLSVHAATCVCDTLCIPRCFPALVQEEQVPVERVKSAYEQQQDQQRLAAQQTEERRQLQALREIDALERKIEYLKSVAKMLVQS